MKIEIIKILDRGDKENERLWLKVLEDCDLIYYLVIDTIYTSPTSISSIPKHTFWFKSKKVKAGDYIILYTRKGTPSESKNNQDTTNHFFFWELDKPLWGDKENCAVLYEINSWKTSLKE
tara:strand:- start:173 stop:532 length:360 start_codon:yes stop_codon:yes gene_type:complete